MNKYLVALRRGGKVAATDPKTGDVIMVTHSDYLDVLVSGCHNPSFEDVLDRAIYRRDQDIEFDKARFV